MNVHTVHRLPLLDGERQDVAVVAEVDLAVHGLLLAEELDGARHGHEAAVRRTCRRRRRPSGRRAEEQPAGLRLDDRRSRARPCAGPWCRRRSAAPRPSDPSAATSTSTSRFPKRATDAGSSRTSSSRKCAAVHAADAADARAVRVADLEELVADPEPRPPAVREGAVVVLGLAAVADARAEPDALLLRPLQRAAAVVRLPHQRGHEPDGPDGVGPEADPGPDLAELRRRLVHGERHVVLEEDDGQREARDATPDDGEVEGLGGRRRRCARHCVAV